MRFSNRQSIASASILQPSRTRKNIFKVVKEHSSYPKATSASPIQAVSGTDLSIKEISPIHPFDASKVDFILRRRRQKQGGYKKCTKKGALKNSAPKAAKRGGTKTF